MPQLLIKLLLVQTTLLSLQWLMVVYCSIVACGNHNNNYSSSLCSVSLKGRRSFSGGSPMLGHGTQFHSLADSIGNNRRPKRSKSSPGMDVQVLPMTVLDPNQIPATIAT